jgi:hypothetical protein
MNLHLAPKQQDQILLGAALALALGSAAWFGWRSLAVTKMLQAGPAGAKSSAAPYQSPDIGSPKVETATWAPPPEQSRGKDWVYEVFTPPEIFYDPRTKQFSVTPPSRETGPKLAAGFAGPFGLELREVKRELFRLQLVGYVGGEGNYRGTFQNMVTGETLLAGAGRRIPALKLEILRLDVSRRLVALPDSAPSSQVVATAAVRDELTGETVELNSRERCLTRTLVAIVAPSDSPGTLRELRLGESFKSGPATYKITKIQLAPPAADVTKEASDLQKPESRTLTPSAAAGPAPTLDKPTSAPR